jgi:hypothetical protein
MPRINDGKQYRLRDNVVASDVINGWHKKMGDGTFLFRPEPFRILSLSPEGVPAYRVDLPVTAFDALMEEVHQ